MKKRYKWSRSSIIMVESYHWLSPGPVLPISPGTSYWDAGPLLTHCHESQVVHKISLWARRLSEPEVKDHTSFKPRGDSVLASALVLPAWLAQMCRVHDVAVPENNRS